MKVTREYNTAHPKIWTNLSKSLVDRALNRCSAEGLLADNINAWPPMSTSGSDYGDLNVALVKIIFLYTLKELFLVLSCFNIYVYVC
jgi:hypothetical protein